MATFRIACGNCNQLIYVSSTMVVAEWICNKCNNLNSSSFPTKTDGTLLTKLNSSKAIVDPKTVKEPIVQANVIEAV